MKRIDIPCGLLKRRLGVQAPSLGTRDAIRKESFSVGNAFWSRGTVGPATEEKDAP